MSQTKEISSKNNWETKEQEYIKYLIEQKQIKSWKSISKLVNQKFPTYTRSGKQCRQRYVNYIKFDLIVPKLQTWGQEDDTSLFYYYKVYGSQWTKIAEKMPGRYHCNQRTSQNSIKNRFYGVMKKAWRKIGKVEKIKKLKHTKSIKFQGFIKIIGYKNSQVSITQDLACRAEQLRQKCINLAIQRNQKYSELQTFDLISSIHSFYCQLRQSVLKKHRDQNVEQQQKIKDSDEEEERFQTSKITKNSNMQIQAINFENSDEGFEGEGSKQPKRVVGRKKRNQVEQEVNQSEDLQKVVCQIFNKQYKYDHFIYF